jgi:glycosyltransferase involved in cell wall biosynthesis
MPSVAIVTARSPDGTQGGAERLYEGLVEAFKNAGWDAQEVPIIFDESSTEKILEGYKLAQNLNLLMYDLVISTKSPTYCVLHPNHAVWLVHTIRVFYDKYEEVIAKEPWAPKAREMIHRMDNLALRRKNLRRFSIGETVTRRLEKYNGLDAITMHPPHPQSSLFLNHDCKTYYKNQNRYIFTVSRLHSWKRVDLIIKAKKLMKENVRLIIAGDGPEMNNLRELASGNDDIEFLGRVSDDVLLDLYENAIAVPFVPSNEDYGYITIEAFLKGIPIVTVNDSGEAAEIVAHSGGGIVCDNTPLELARALDQISSNAEISRKLGLAGRKWVSTLNWAKIVEALSNDQN